MTLNETGAGGNGGFGQSYYFDAPPSPDGGAGGNGGGIANTPGYIADLRNTIVALNVADLGGVSGTNYAQFIFGQQPPPPVLGQTGAPGNGPDAAGVFSSQGFNLVSAADGSIGLTNKIAADQVGTLAQPINPMLAPLAQNGGFTPTHALLWGSPAIDQGKSFGIRAD